MLLDHLQTLTQSTKLVQKVHLPNPRKGKKQQVMMRLQIPFPRSPDKHQIRNKKVKGDNTTSFSRITDKGVHYKGISLAQEHAKC